MIQSYFGKEAAMNNRETDRNEANLGRIRNDHEENQSQPLSGAIGYGLNPAQQSALVDLWRWHQASLNSNIKIGGENPLSR